MRQFLRVITAVGVVVLIGCDSADPGPRAAPSAPARALSCEGTGKVTRVQDGRGDVAANVRENNDGKVIPPELPEADLRGATVARGNGSLCATFEMYGAAEVPTLVQLNLFRPTPQGDAVVVASVKIGLGQAPAVTLEPSDAPSSSEDVARADVSGHMVKLMVVRRAFPAGLKHVFDRFGWQAQTYAAGPRGIQYSDCAPETPYRVTYPGGRAVRPANPPGNCF